MNTSVLVNGGGFTAYQSQRELRGNRRGVVAALFTMLLFFAGCGGSNSTPATPTPTFSPAAGTYAGTQNVTVSDTNQSTVLYCTTDGSTPTASSPQCTNPIKISQSQTLSAIAMVSGKSPSAAATAAYVITASASAPTVSGIGPASGSTAGGTSVTVIGTNFTGATSVNFGTTAATSVTVNSATSITAVSPAGTGSVHVTVVTSSGRSATNTADLFTYSATVSAPAITGISPNSVPTGNAGFTLSVYGTNFVPGATVQWNNTTSGTSSASGAGSLRSIAFSSGNSFTRTDATSRSTALTTTFVSSTELQAAVPANLVASAGSIVVAVTNPDGSSSGSAPTGSTFAVGAPTIASIFPASVASGTSAFALAVNGTDFASGATVLWGSTPLTTTLANSTQLLAAVPASLVATAGTATVTVTDSTGTSPGATFTITNSAPVITALSKTSGLAGAQVTVSGSNFGFPQGSSTLTFGGVAATVTSWNLGALVATVPNGAITGNVVVTVNNVTSNGLLFTVLLPPATTPVITPSTSGVLSGTLVKITDSSSGVTIYYTIDGSTPSATNGTAYSGPITVNASETINAIAVGDSYAPSSVATAVYTLLTQPATPVISPAAGAVPSGTQVTIEDSTPDVTIYYTTDGSKPSATNGTAYSGTIPVTKAETISAIAVGGSSNAPSTIATAAYTILPQAATPMISPAAGAVVTGTQVTITDSSSGATVYYTTDGSTPSATNGTAYTSPITVSQIETINAIAVGSSYSPSEVATAAYTVLSKITGTVVSGPNNGSGTPISASVQLYQAGTTGYGAGSQTLGSPVQTNATTGVFPAIIVDCTTLTAPGDQLYLVAKGSISGTVLTTALGSCANIASVYPGGVTINEATTIASAFALAGFANNTDPSSGQSINIGAPTNGSSCNATAGWKSTGTSTCNYIGLKNAFATVTNLVDIPSGRALAITPAYCLNAPCITATTTGSTANTTLYYATSIVPQGRINAMANALSACVNPTTGNSTNCGTLSTATEIKTSTYLDGGGSLTNCAAANLNTLPADTLQAVLNIAHFPGDRAGTACGVDIGSSAGIYSLVPATGQTYQPTLTASTSGNTETDLSLALIFQGGGLGGPSNGQGSGVNGPPLATGLAIDAGGNLWVPTISSTGGSLVVLNNQGAPISPAGNSSTNYGGYTTGVYNPQSIAIDQDGNAWIGNSPAGGVHGQTANGSLSEIQLSGTTLSTLQNKLSGGSTLLTPAQYGLAIDASNNVWLSSNPGVGGLTDCSGGSYGGSILEFNSAGIVQNGSGYLNYSDNSSCPTALAFDESGLLWTYDRPTSGSDSPNLGILQLTSSGTVAGGPYANALQNPSYSVCNVSNDADVPSAMTNMAIDSLGDSWFASSLSADACMYVIPNMTTQNASSLISSGSWGWVLFPASFNVEVGGSTVIDGGNNAWATTINPSSLIGYSSQNASASYESGATDTALLTPQPGYEATDPSVNASGRTGGTQALSPTSFGTGLGVDGSGNLWVSGAQLTEFIGIAVPAQTPLAAALSNSTNGPDHTGIGVKP